MEIITVSASTECLVMIEEWIMRRTSNPVLILASGGSSAKVFAEAWKQLSQEQKDNVTLSLADERFGEPDHENSNWKLLRDLGVDVDQARHIPVNSGNASLQETAKAWERRLEAAFDSGIPVISLLGIGDDSHIAGIKPRSPSSTEGSRLVSAYEWDDYERITITPVAIKRLTSIRVYASGETKREAIELLEKELDPTEYPSQLLRQIDDCTVYYVPKG